MLWKGTNEKVHDLLHTFQNMEKSQLMECLIHTGLSETQPDSSLWPSNETTQNYN